MNQYLEKLKEYRPAIADFISRCERGQLTAEDRTLILRYVHALACESESAGYERIGKAALAMEDALVGQNAGPHLLHMAHRLHQLCHEALVFLPHAAQQRVLAPAPLLARRPVMVTADDDRTVRAMIQSMFEAHAQVIMAEDGQSALAALERYHPDLLLLDDTMPGMTGLRLAEKLQVERPEDTTCIIMLTASDRPQDMNRAHAAGVAEYIMKPFDPYQLSATVWQTLARIVR